MAAKLKHVGDEYLVSLLADAVAQLAPDGPCDQVNVDVAVQDGQVVLRPCAEAESARVRQLAEKAMKDYDSALRRLAK